MRGSRTVLGGAGAEMPRPTQLGLETEAPKKAPARSPPELAFEFVDGSPDEDDGVGDKVGEASYQN